MVRDNEYDEYEGLDNFGFDINNDKTIADYHNFRNILFQYSQELDRAVTNFKFKPSKTYHREAVKKYLTMYYQLNEKKRLNKLKKEQIEYMKYFYNNYYKINLKVLNKLNILVCEILNKYGVYDISKQQEMYR